MNFLRYNVLVMKYGCLIPLNKTSSKLFKIYFHLFRFINIVLTTWFIGITFFYYFLIDKSFSQLSQFLNSLIFIGVLLRFSYYYINDKKVLEIIINLNKMFKKTSSTGLEDISINSDIKHVNYACLLLIIVCWTAATIFALPILIMKESSLTPLWYPYNSTISPYYEFSCVFHLFSQYLMTYNYNSVDTFYICLMIATAGQFKILAWEMENVCYTSLLRCGVDKKAIVEFKSQLGYSEIIKKEDYYYEIYCIMQTKKYQKALENDLKSIISYHRDVLSFCKLLEKFLSPIMLLIFLSTLNHSVMILYSLSLADSFSDSLTIVGYFVAAAMEFFLIAFTSDLLIRESSKVQFAIYSTPWYFCSKKNISTIKFCHFRLGKFFGLSLGKFTPFDLRAYSWLMKSSFSYFTVLRGR